MGNLFLGIIAFYIIGSIILGFFIAIFRPRKKTVKIILNVILLGYSIYLCISPDASYKGYSVWHTILAVAIAYIPAYFIGYMVIKAKSYVCPNCGEWNNAEIIEVLAEQNYKQRVDVKRDIRNKDGEKIGSFDDSEIHDMSRKLVRIKCNVCGHISTETIEEDLSK